MASLFLPGLAGVGGGPDFRVGRRELAVLLIGEFYGDYISGQSYPGCGRDDASPGLAAVAGVIENSAHASGPDLRTFSRNSAEEYPAREFSFGSGPCRLPGSDGQSLWWRIARHH